jgi:exodeoxyribonuclease III
MKIGTWNVNGIRKRNLEFVAWVRRDRPDVVCLQEIKASPEQIAVVLSELIDLGDYRSYWHGSASGYSGVSIHLSREAFPAAPTFSHPAFDHENRIVEATVERQVFASVYVPNGGKDFDAKIRFLREMREYVAGLHREGKSLVMCGDMNVARTDRDVHPSQQGSDVIGQRPDERALFEAILAENLVDVGRALEPDNDRLFTWWPYWRDSRKRNLGWRLDYVLATGSKTSAKACTVLTDFGTSDHAPVLAVLEP